MVLNLHQLTYSKVKLCKNILDFVFDLLFFLCCVQQPGSYCDMWIGFCKEGSFELFVKTANRGCIMYVVKLGIPNVKNISS